MNDIRAKFEEIWPVPEGVYWRDSKGQYGCDNHAYEDAMDAHNIRLDTFTRCQETTALYVGIIEELVYELETAYTAGGVLPACVDRAKQITGKEK
jgi:hypothetical protein